MSTYLQYFAERFATLDSHNLDLLNDLYSPGTGHVKTVCSVR